MSPNSNDDGPQIERRATQRTWTPQTLAPVAMVVFALFGAGWSVVSTLQSKFDAIGSEIVALNKSLALVMERQGRVIMELDAFKLPGDRFTAKDGDKVNARLDSIVSQITDLERELAIMRDRRERGAK